MAEYISEELIRQTLRDAVGTEGNEELMSTVLDVKAQVEMEHQDYPDYTEVNDLVKGMRAWWLTERAIDIVESRHQQLAARREQMIAQEMGLDGTVPQPAQYQQPVQQMSVVPTGQAILLAIGVGLLSVGVSYGLYRWSMSGEDNGRDE